jgi:type I restriction enzyme S subunit
MSEFVELRVGEHVGFLSGFPFSSELFHNEDGVRLIRIRDLLGAGENVIFFSGQFDPRWLVRDGDTLIGMDGDFHVVRWRSGRALLNQRILKVEPRNNSGITGDYFYHWVGPRLLEIHGRTAATTVKHLSVRDLKNAVGAFPSVTSQLRIAEILTTLDEEIEATEALIGKYQQIKAGLMHDLFTRGLWTQAEIDRGDHKGTPHETTAKLGRLRPTPEEAPEVYQTTPIGLMPNCWSFASISDLAAVKGGKRLPAGTPFSETPTQFPYLRVTDMVDGWIDERALAFVDPQTEPLIKNYKIFRDDIYVTIAGTLGQFGRIPPHLHGAQLTENAARITEIDQTRVCLDFMCAFLRSDRMAAQKFRAYGMGAGVPKLALYQIENFLLPLPPMPEQFAIENALRSSLADLQSNLTHLSKLREQKQGLMHDLLTGRVRVA